MTKLPLVSIIIPTYNYGNLIGETIMCLQEQTYTNWEAIIIDDGSIDNTEEVVCSFIKNDCRINYIKQNNSGVSVARNTGLRVAKGDYIQFLDADDLISKEKIRLQVAFLEENKSIYICLVNAFFFENDDKSKLYNDLILENKTKTQPINGSGYEVISAFVETNLVVIESPLFRSTLLNKIGVFRENMDYLEDWDFWFRFSINNYKFHFLNDKEAYILVRSHSKSATKQGNKIKVAEGKLRALLNEYILKSNLSVSEKDVLISKNNKLLINTFKDIMAKTSYLDFKNFFSYYKEMNSLSNYLKALIKSINLKRKLNRPINS